MSISKKEKVMIFDTTLRDGEQAAGARLGAREKLEIARQLTRLRVDIIEAGFPASSPEDFEAVRLISEQIEGPVICGLTRAVAKYIEVCRKALAKAKRSRIHTGIGVSEIHIAGKFRDADPYQLLEYANPYRLLLNKLWPVQPDSFFECLRVVFGVMMGGPGILTFSRPCLCNLNTNYN